VVGSYLDANNLSGHYHGFLYNGRTYTTLDDPLGTGSSYAYDINDAGLVVGRYSDHAGMHGFLYNPTGGTYTTLDDPLADNDTQAYGINSAGLVVGIYFRDSDTPHGFLYNPNGGTYTTLDDPLAANGFDNPFAASGTVAEGINAAGQIVGYYADSNDDYHGFLYNGGIYTTLDDPQAFDTYAFGINKNGHVVGVRLDKFGDRGFLETPVPNPPPPAATTADMILRGANGSPAAGQYQIYDIGNNAILAGYSLAQIGTDWQFAGLGGFFGSDTTDMLLRNTNTGGLEVYDIANNQITNAAFIGAVGLDWQFSGVGNFSGVPGETDLLLRNSTSGGLEVYDVNNNQLTGAAFLGPIGLEWQFAGVAPIHAPGASDLVLRNVNSGAFEVYDIANNTITSAASLGAVGLDWQLGGFAVDPPTASSASMADSSQVAQLVQTMAGFGGTSGAADGLNTAALGTDTLQQTFLTTPQYA
jgi:probable HAF family extracellular repeat protein